LTFDHLDDALGLVEKHRVAGVVATNTTPGVWLLKKGQEDDEEYNQALTVITYLRGKGIKIRFRVTEVK